MRGTFGLIGLVIVLALVGLVIKKQMAATTAPVPALQQGATAPTGSVRQQSQQVQEQLRQQMDALMQQARPMPEDAEK